MNERDPDLDALWRRLPPEQPAASVDDAIRAAARRAVHAGPAADKARARAPLPAWTTLLAAASIGAIAIGLWQVLPHEIDETQMTASDVPAQASRSAPNAPPPMETAKSAPRAIIATEVAPSMASKRGEDAKALERQLPQSETSQDKSKGSGSVMRARVPTSQSAMRERMVTPADTPRSPSVVRKDARSQSSPSAVANAVPGSMPKRSPTTDSAQQGGVTGSESVPAPVPAVQPATKPQPFPMPSPAAAESTLPTSTQSMALKRSAEADAREQFAPSAKPSPMRTVDSYVDAIRRLLAERRDAEAMRTLNAMRAHYAGADLLLPAELRAWAANVPRELR